MGRGSYVKRKLGLPPPQKCRSLMIISGKCNGNLFEQQITSGFEIQYRGQKMIRK